MTYWLRRKHELQYPVIERCVNGRRAAKVLHTSERERFSRELAFERLWDCEDQLRNERMHR